ncbi:MAG: LCP family protein [Oscillospiraceae bacterium]|nr:LCP family protein [Oscillospiraceae bacterium]
MSNKKTGASSGKRLALQILCAVLAVVLVALLGATVYVEFLLGKMNYVDRNAVQETLSVEEIQAIDEELQEEEGELSGPVLDESEVDLGDGADVEIGGDNIVNILLIGQDTRDGGRARSDSMILCTFNLEENELTLTSFMRDLYVSIPGYKNTRINAAYAYGGMQLLNETLYENFGVVVDGNVEVDFEQFTEIIDLLGGVELELTSREVSYLREQVPGSKFVEGMNLLNGEEALVHARNRRDVDGDFSRTNRQRQLLTALMDKYKSSDITTMLLLMDDILPMITTDMTKDQIVGYVKELFPLLMNCEMSTQSIPVAGGYYDAVIGGAQVLVPDMEMNIQALMNSLVGDEGVG